MMTASLEPSVPVDCLYPENAVFMARTSLYETRMLGFNDLHLDSVTAHLAGLVNGRTAIRHEAGAGDEVFSLYRRAGIDLAEETLTYRTRLQAERLAESLIIKGKRLFYPYPPPKGRYPEESHLVPPEVISFLNAKVNLESLVPVEFLPKRTTLSHEQLANFEPAEPVFLKAAGEASTGWGYAVHPCLDKSDFNKARCWFADHLESAPMVLVEEWVEVKACWCAGLVVSEDQTLCFGGAEQLFSAPGKQQGSMIEPELRFPEEGEKLVVQIGDAARKLGYRGIAGIDVGLRNDGRMVVFDPNFRFNSSTAQLIYYKSAVSRTGLSVSSSFDTRVAGSFRELSCRLEAPISEGWFVPTRVFNAEKHKLCEGKHIVTGFVMANSRAESEEAVMRMKKVLS